MAYRESRLNLWNSMNDLDFLKGFHDGSLPPGEFRHRGHIRLAWLVISRHGFEEARSLVSSGIRQYALSKGAVSMYHETLTQFWVRLVNHAIQTGPSVPSFEEFLESFPMLLSKELPSYHWRPETLGSNSARAGWIGPDLLDLPF